MLEKIRIKTTKYYYMYLIITGKHAIYSKFLIFAILMNCRFEIQQVFKLIFILRF